MHYSALALSAIYQKRKEKVKAKGEGPYAQKSQARYYHQPGDQKYAQYSKIIQQPAAIITNQVLKSTPSTSNYT
ncbi:hypothetical protein ACFX1Q_000067 [Malus domestica]